jgi:AcrR family transcriptional regulator
VEAEMPRMPGADRREQVLSVAAEEFAQHGLHGISAEVVARRAGISHAYVFRLFGTKRELFLEVVRRAFAQMTDALREAAGDATEYEALSRMGSAYNAMLADRTMLLLHLQAFAASGDERVRSDVRAEFGRMWQTVANATGLEAVQIKTFMAYGMLLNTNAALDLAAVDEPWADQARTRIQPGLFTHITSETNK